MSQARSCEATRASNLARMAERAEEAAELLASMANPKRLLVLCHLVEAERSVGELATVVDLGQSALSQHLSRMRALGLVRARRDGQSVFYRLASPEVRRLLATLYELYCGPPDSAPPLPTASVPARRPQSLQK